MAYPSDNKPRRRMQAVPDMSQMIRRRAASPAGALKKGGVGYLGPPVKQGGIPRRQVQPIQRPTQPPGGTPGPFWQGGGQPGRSPEEGQGNPLEHQRYWAAQGWLYDPRDQRFNFVGNKALEQYLQTGIPSLGGRPNPDGGGGGGPGYQGGPTTGGGGGGGGVGIPGGSPGPTTGGGGNPPPTTGGGNEPPVTGPPVPDVDPSTGLPLDALYEAQQRMLSDRLAAQLGMIAPQREQVLADRALQEARLGTNETVDQRHMLESLAGRGAFGGGIQRRDQGYLSTDYLRQRQDLASGVAQSLAGLSRGESEANLSYQQGLMEALLELANRQAMSEYAVTPHPDTTELPYEDWFGSDLGGGGTTGGGGGGGGGGGAGGGWEPSWKPDWRPQGGGGGGGGGGNWQPSWEPKPRRRR